MRLNFFRKLVILVLTVTLTATGIVGYVLLSGMETLLKAEAELALQSQAAELAHDAESMLQEKSDLAKAWPITDRLLMETLLEY